MAGTASVDTASRVTAPGRLRVAPIESPILAATNDGALIAAILTGIAAVITAWAAVLRAKDRGARDCNQQLADTRAEAEAARVQLHRLRMAHPEVIDDAE